MLDFLFPGRIARSLDELLTDAHRSEAPIGFWGPSRVGQRLGSRWQITELGGKKRKEFPVNLELADGSLAGLVLFVRPRDWLAHSAEWQRVVAVGGPIIVVARARAVELSRLALCGGLTAIRQREQGRAVITCGTVTSFRP